MSVNREDPAACGWTDPLARVLLGALMKEASACLGAGECELFFEGEQGYSAESGSDSPFLRVFFFSGDTRGLLEFRQPKNGQFNAAQRRFARVLVSYGARAAAGMERFSLLRRDTAVLRREKEQGERYASIGMMAIGLLPRIAEPLALISERCQSLREACAGTTAGRYLGEIARGLKRIERTVSSMLSDAGSATAPASVPAGLASILDDSIELCAGGLARDVRIRRDYDPRLPALPDMGLEHVFVNIIKNAFEAMPHGGELLVTARSGVQGIRVSFTDTGPGIPPKYRERVFEPFFTTKENGGTGLGLSISREIVRNFGGEIEVESLPGKGSSFTVFIPIKEVSECPRGRL